MDHSLTSAFIRECKEKRSTTSLLGLVWGRFLSENSLWLLGWDGIYGTMSGAFEREATSACHIFCVGHDWDM